MYKLCLLLVLLCFSPSAEAQIFGPVAVPVDKEKRDRNRKWLAMEVSAGANLITRRRLLTPSGSVDGLEPGFGPRAGPQGLGFPEAEVQLVLGVDYLRDRGTLVGYRRGNSGFFIQNTTELPLRVRTGEVTIKENWWRVNAGLGFSLGPVNALLGLHASGIISGSQRYDYEERLNALEDPITGQVIPLNPAAVSTGSRDFFRDFYGGYGGMIFELSYPFTERLRLQLEYEQGWHLDANGGRYEEWRQRRSRMGLTIGYRLFALERRR